jgi:cytochrome c-type biogenesis protein CcmH
MRAAAVAALAILLLATSPASALAACPKTSMGDIEDEVMCLQCGVPLNVAEEAPAAKRERVFIQQQIDRCQSKAQIKDQLVAQFGTRILADPQSKSAWLVPVLAFAGGALAIGYAAWHWRRRRSTTSPPAGAAVSAGDSARIDADIDRYEL